MKQDNYEPWPPAMQARMRELYEGGDSFTTIAGVLSEEFDRQVSRSAVAGQCRRGGIGTQNRKEGYITLNGNGIRWTLQMDVRLRAMCKQELSFVDISQALSLEFGRPITRFAACARYRRLISEQQSRAKALPPERIARATSPFTDLEIPIGQRRTLQELSACMCRWPVGDPMDSSFFFCGGVIEPRGSYCHDHKMRSVG